MIFLIELFKLLNTDFNYVVLRNYDGLPEQIISRDIDILITKDELKKLCKILPKLLRDTDCMTLYCNEDNQFFTIVIKDQNNQLFQLDFQYNFAWMGIDLLNEIEVLQHRIFNGKIYHLNAMYTFLPKYLYCRILGAKYPEKYKSIRDAAVCESGERIERILNYLSLNKGGIQYWDITNKWTLRLRSFTAALLHKPHRALFHLFCFVYWIIKSLLLRRGLMISFTGPDGCGKTTVIDLLQKRFIVNTPELFHFRPSVLPNLGEVGAKAGIIKEVDRDFSRPHRGKKKNFLSSLIRLMYYMLDYILGYFVKILPLRQRKHIVFFDRYFTDVIVDHERSSIFLSHKMLAPLRYLVPRCQYNFLLRVDPDTILQRKQELTRGAIERIYSRMQYLAERDKRYFWIDNNGSPEDAVAQILNIIAEHNRNAKKI